MRALTCLLLAACDQSLFDSHGAPDGGADSAIALDALAADRLIAAKTKQGYKAVR